MRPLRLKYPPQAANAARFADDIAAAAARIDGVRLDFTPGSLAVVDQRLEKFREEGTSSEAIAETVFGFGCYVGEVMARHAGGRWRDATEREIGWFGFPMLIEFPDQRLCNPIGKAFKRVDNGSVDSLPYFYQVSTAPPSGGS